MSQDLRGSMIFGGALIANVSPSKSSETFQFPGGEVVNVKLTGNPTKIESKAGETALIYKRGTDEWSSLQATKARVDEMVRTEEKKIRARVESEIKKELEAIAVAELAAAGILVEGKEHLVKPSDPPAVLTPEQQAKNDKYFEADDEEGDGDDGDGEPDVDLPESHVCPEAGCGRSFETQTALTGHSGAHAKAAKASK